MPWRETSLMDQRVQFIGDYTRALWPVSELCRRYGISRKTGYKWLTRYEAHGPAGLTDRSRRPHHCPTATPPELECALLDAKQRHPLWGAKKLLPILAMAHPTWPWPSEATANRLLKHHGLVRPQRRRRPHARAIGPRTLSQGPNDVWTADFKGEFRTGDGQYCYPLTILDDAARYLLACQGLAAPTTRATRRTFAHLFRTVGIPQVIRTDNGTPFASTGLTGLSRLAVWWIRLGITPERIAPAHPEQNGRHERFHRTLKAATAHPPAPTRRAQQQRFTHFRHEYNHLRPHEALDQTTPAAHYQPSDRPAPAPPPPLEYPAHYELRRVGSNGCIVWRGRPIFSSHVLAGEVLGLAELTVGYWEVYFGPRYLGLLDERHRHIDEAGRPVLSPKVLPMS